MTSHRSQLLCILGGPGAGKTTLSSALNNKIPNSIILKSGTLLRHAVNEGCIPHRDSVNCTMDKGALVKDEVVNKIVVDEILKNVNNETIDMIIIDGFPRTESQIKSLKDVSVHIGGVIVLDAAEPVLEKRCKIRNLKTDRIDDMHQPVIERINDFQSHIGGLRNILEHDNVKNILLNTCGSVEDTVASAVRFALQLR